MGTTTIPTALPDPTQPNSNWTIDQWIDYWMKGTPAPGDVIAAQKAAQKQTPSGGGGGGGGGGATIGKSYDETFYDWMGRYPTSAERRKMANEGWTEDTIRRFAVKNGGNGAFMVKAINTVRQVAASWYDGDPSGIPSSLVNTLISDGIYADTQYLEQTYFPLLRGLRLTDPNAQTYIDAWVEMTGKSLSTDAFNKLSEFVQSYGYGTEAEAAWLAWVKTTDAAITGNWGAEHREAIRANIASLFGRDPTEEELDVSGDFWNLNEAARMEYLRGTDEYYLLYANKPAWMDEADFIDAARAYDAVMRWYYSENAYVNEGGSIVIPTGPYDTRTISGGTQGTRELQPRTQEPTIPPTAEDTTGYTPSVMAGQEIPPAEEQHGYRPTPFSPNQETPTGYQPSPLSGAGGGEGTSFDAGTYTPPLSAFGVTYLSPQMVADLIAGGITPEQLQQQFQWQQDAIQYALTYDEMLTEAFGKTFTEDEWTAFAAGGEGSGALKAMLTQAQNRVAYREEFNRLFGYDPDPEDYERIMQEYISPAMMVKYVEAGNSAEEMYDEVNDLLMRVYGDGVTLDELKAMALGQEGTGELKALINQATKLDAFTEIHRQYYDAAPTPEDYAKYAGYTSAAELQWEIVTQEAVKENRDIVQEAWAYAYPDETLISDDDLYTMYGEQEGYGELRAKVTKAKEEYDKYEEGQDWAYSYAEHADIGYRASDQGGFRTSTTRLADL